MPVVLEDKVEREKIRAAEDQQKQKRLCNEPVVKTVSHQPTRSNPTFYHKNKRHTTTAGHVIWLFAAESRNRTED